MSDLLNKSYPVQMQSVFEVDSGVTEWIVAIEPNEVKEFLKEQCGYGDDDIEHIEIDICSNERLHKLTFTDDDGSKRSMFDELQIQLKERSEKSLFNKPFSLASTEY